MIRFTWTKGVEWATALTCLVLSHTADCITHLLMDRVRDRRRLDRYYMWRMVEEEDDFEGGLPSCLEEHIQEPRMSSLTASAHS